MSKEYTNADGLRTAFSRVVQATEALYAWSQNAKDPAGNFPSPELSEEIRKAFIVLSDCVSAADKNSAWLAEAANYAQKMPPYMKMKDPT